MGQVQLTPRARQDLLIIWLHLATEAGPVTADRLLDRIEQRCEQLAQHPELGPARPDIDPSARHLVIERWLALYAIVPGGVLVVRVVDAKRDLPQITLTGE